MPLPQFGFYDVTAYGAVGDGVHDDSTAIYNAELACEATGGVVYFPPGKYLIGTAHLTIPIAKSGVQWRGAGAGSSIIVANPGTNTALSLVSVGGASAAVTDITVRDLGFLGNGMSPPSGVPNLPVIAFGYSSLSAGRCKIIDCSFSSNTGYTIGFAGVANAEVVGCRFVDVGYYNGDPPGDANVTPAVFADENCTNIRVHHNYFAECQFDGVRLRATESEVASNFFDQCYGSAVNAGDIHAEGSDIRIISNYARYTHKVGGNNQAIYIQHLKNSVTICNIVFGTDGDGIAGGGCSAEVNLGNIIYDNCVSAGDCAIQYIGQPDDQFPNAQNFGVAIVGNVCYDDTGSSKQLYGLHIFTTQGDLLKASPLVGNSFWGNDEGDLGIDNAFTDDSNVSWVNTAGWNDRQHGTSYNPPNGLTGTTAKTSLLNSPLTIGAYSISDMGIRVVASGAASGTSSKTFFLGFGDSGNIMTKTVSGGASNKYWQIIAYIMDQSMLGTSPTYVQYAMVQFWYDGSLAYETPAVLSQNIADELELMLEAQLDSAGDHIYCHFVSVERI